MSEPPKGPHRIWMDGMAKLAATVGIGPRPGWTGAFTDKQAEGALPNGTIVRKVRSEPHDATPDGTTGVVLGSLHAEGMPFFYFIEWSNLPKHAVGVIDWKVVPEGPAT